MMLVSSEWQWLRQEAPGVGHFPAMQAISIFPPTEISPTSPLARFIICQVRKPLFNGPNAMLLLTSIPVLITVVRGRFGAAPLSS